MQILTTVDELVAQARKLGEKYQQLESLKAAVQQEIPELREAIKEPMEGTIVMKKVCCHKSACNTCGGKKNAHGPYPHLQWHDEKGNIKTRYVSRKNLEHFTTQLELSKKLKRRERLLVKIFTRLSAINVAVDMAYARLLGKGVNADVQA